MNIIFQSGEFIGQNSSFWTNIISIIGAILGALISGLIAIHIFKSGIEEQHKKEIQSKRKNSTELESYLFHLIGFMNSTILQQVNEIERTSQALKKFEMRNLTLNSIPALSTDDVNVINSEDLYHIFVISRSGSPENKASDLFNLKSCFRYIDQEKEFYIEFNKTLLKNLNEFQNSWNENLKKLVSLYNEFAYDADNNNINPVSDNFLDFYKKIIIHKQRELITKNEFNNIAKSHHELILPLKKYIRDKKAEDQRVLLITTSVIACDQAINEMTQLIHSKRKTILKSGRKLLGVKRLMNECIHNTKKRKKH